MKVHKNIGYLLYDNYLRKILDRRPYCELLVAVFADKVLSLVGLLVVVIRTLRVEPQPAISALEKALTGVQFGIVLFPGTNKKANL